MSEFLTDAEVQVIRSDLEFKAAIALLLYKLYSLTYTDEELKLAEDVANWYENHKLNKA